MKTIGLIGGISWQSTASYYAALNKQVAARLGGLHSAKIVMESLDFAEVEARQQAGRWDELGRMLAAAAQGLEGAGAELMLIGANTMHKVAPAVQAAIGVPLLHIADAAADALLAQNITTAGLLGTIYTMTEDFYTARLRARGIQVVLPAPAQMEEVNRVIFEELCLGKIEEKSKQFYLDVIADLSAQGAGGVVLGCTEIGLLVQQAQAAVPLFDTTHLHVQAAVDAALA